MLSRIRALLGRGLPSAARPRRVIPLLEYDRALKVELLALPQRTQAAFAVACAERLYPAYAAFVTSSGREDHGLVRHTLDVAWEGARSGSVQGEDPAALFELSVALIPSDDSGQDPIPAHAADAIAAAAYGLQAAAGLDKDAAGWAANVGSDCLDNFLLTSEIDLSDPDADQKVWVHPLVRAEVDRRAADLRRLAADPDSGAAVDDVRASATGLSALPLDGLHHPA
jgi:uncharacterized protein YjaG (DUF416 family)